MTPVEFVFLGLNRFKPANRSDDQVEEDRFCEKLQLIGPIFQIDDDYPPAYLRDPQPPPPLFSDKFCWPRSGGAWVRKLWTSQQVEGYDDFYGNNDTLLTYIGSIKNAYTMEERCQAFEKAGAKFCARLEDCEETKRFSGKEIWPEEVNP